jgi:cell division protein FtsI (penicillin-binding protein 3)/stage V sporulation protein D (sporulation-specific penicillin-binding protein)
MPSHWRFIFIFFLFIFCFSGLSYRILDLCCFSRDYYKKFIDSARQTREVKRAIRGRIRDRRGTILAMTTVKIDIGVDPQVANFQGDQPKIDQLAELLDRDPREVAECFRRESFIRNGREQFLRWKKIATLDDGDRYEKVKQLQIRGVYGVEHGERIYPQRELASHVIGFVNREWVAACGIERFLDDFLRGHDGWVESERDGKREEVALFRKVVIEPQDGAHVNLTLDLHIQEIAERALQRAVAELNPKSGSVIVSDPQSGEILALCNAPTFDCNAYGQAEASALRNRAIADVYEPGSVFKIVPFSTALQLGLIAPNRCFNCSQETFQWEGKTYPLPQDHKFFGVLSAVDVLRQSSNRGVAQIGIMLGAERLYRSARAFGFGEKTGYGFDGESAGLLHKPASWDPLTITRLPMGHAVGATALQVHRAMGVIASGGYLLQPRIVSGVVDDRGEAMIETAPAVLRQVLEPSIARQLAEILHNPESALSVAERVKLAYKTGTTQKLVGGVYSRERHIASCSGFFPMEEPKFLVTVVLDEPTMAAGTAYGVRAAYPVFAEVARALILRLGLGP